MFDRWPGAAAEDALNELVTVIDAEIDENSDENKRSKLASSRISYSAPVAMSLSRTSRRRSWASDRHERESELTIASVFARTMTRTSATATERSCRSAPAGDAAECFRPRVTGVRIAARDGATRAETHRCLATSTASALSPTEPPACHFCSGSPTALKRKLDLSREGRTRWSSFETAVWIIGPSVRPCLVAPTRLFAQ
jgi:hypothetical protein